MLVTPFSEETEQRMRDFFRSLNEKDRRRYAGLEAEQARPWRHFLYQRNPWLRPEDRQQRDRRAS